jgi:hypothetical protein
MPANRSPRLWFAEGGLTYSRLIIGFALGWRETSGLAGLVRRDARRLDVGHHFGQTRAMSLCGTLLGNKWGK